MAAAILRARLSTTMCGITAGCASITVQIGCFYDRPPFVGLGLLERRHRVDAALVGRKRLLADLAQPRRDCGSASASPTAALSRAITSGGMPFGAHRPCHSEA